LQSSSFAAENDDSDNDSLLHVEQQQPKRTTTTRSQDRMLEHLAYLQMTLGIPWVCWRDFKELNLTHGTIRNNLSTLKNMGYIEYSHRSNNAFYTLPKDQLQNTMTIDYLPVTKPQLTALIKRLAFDTSAVHDIWLRFHCPTIYDRVRRLKAETGDKEIIILPRSQKLVLEREILENGDIEAQITITTRNNVIVSLACSDHPIHFDIPGLVF